MSNTPSPVDNTTGAHDEIPAPGGAGNTVTTKTPWYLSYVLWTNLAGALPPSPVTGEGSTSPVEDRSQDPDQDPSSIPPSSGSSSPLSGTSRLMVVLGALMLLLGGSCSTDADPVAASVSLSDGQVIVIRGSTSLVVDRTEYKLLWSQAAPEAVVAPVVQATSK